MAILPVGSTEQHGPHLGDGYRHGLGGARRATRSARAPACRCCRAIPYGCSLGHSRRWPGTLALAPATLTRVVVDVLSLGPITPGFAACSFSNGHVTNQAPLRCALEYLRAGVRRLSWSRSATSAASRRACAPSSRADGSDWHANCGETVADAGGRARPRARRPRCRRRRPGPDRAGCFFAHPVNRTSTNGVTGTPSRATRAAGERLFAMIVDDLTAARAGRTRANGRRSRPATSRPSARQDARR